MAVNSPPPSFQLPHHILWPSCHLGPMVEGAMTPTSPELGTAAVGKLVQGGKSLRCTLQVSLCLHKSSSCSGYLCLIPPINLSIFTFTAPFSLSLPFSVYSPSLILHLNSYRLKFGLLLCRPSFLWVHLRGGGKTVRLHARVLS